MTRAYFVGWLVAVTQLRVEEKKESSGHRCDGGFMLAGLEPKVRRGQDAPYYNDHSNYFQL